MNYKEEILKTLEDLKLANFNRREVERELKYSFKYIDQQLSKGGNEKLLNALKQLLENKKLRKATGKSQNLEDQPVLNQANESEAAFGIKENKELAELKERNAQLMQIIAEQRLIIEDLKQIINKSGSSSK